MSLNEKKTLYVGGISEEVTKETVEAAFVPFGDLVDVQIPLDYKSQKPRGFAFVEFDLQEDALEALDNMHNSELYGRVLTVNMAKPSVLSKNRAVWQEDKFHLDKDAAEKEAEEVEKSANSDDGESKD
eukprot:TRINITY_DN1084_c0_g1_i2.p1 TRINITY_DN1084_c0_g1~~TRINITY_DN1084_c0_g1_i2.p1  ORF type:complete len:128 (-),score=34.90 TRINITY_DN1084_c0_g1_i2:268-651(-)